MEVNSARNQRLRKVSIMVGLCCIYWKYTGDNGCCNGGLAFQQCRLFSKLYSKAYPSWLSLLVLYSTLPPKVFVPLLFLILILSFKFFGILFCGAQLTCAVRNILQIQTTCFFFERQCYRRRGKKSSITLMTFSLFSFQFSLAFLSTLDLVTQYKEALSLFQLVM